jgi:hypothetical protein
MSTLGPICDFVKQGMVLCDPDWATALKHGAKVGATTTAIRQFGQSGMMILELILTRM